MRTARSHQVVHPHAPQPERIRQRAPHPRSPALRLVNHGVAPPRHRTNHAPAPRVVHVQPNNLGRGRAEHKHHTDQPARRSQGNQPHRGRARRPGPDRQTHENLPAQPPVAGQPRPARPRRERFNSSCTDAKTNGRTHGPNAKEPPGAKPARRRRRQRPVRSANCAANRHGRIHGRQTSRSTAGHHPPPPRTSQRGAGATAGQPRSTASNSRASQGDTLRP